MSQCSLCGGDILDRSDSRYCVYCNSTFHRSCIIEHFYRNKFCPVCNKKMSLIFMRYGEPPQPAVKKKVVPREIRKPKWPEVKRRPEVPLFDVDIPRGPLKRTDKYIPRAGQGGKFSGISRKVKIPRKLAAIVLILIIASVGAYYGRDYLPSAPSLPGEKTPASPWKVVWTYPLEGVSDIAASRQGIAVGGRNGLYLLDQEGSTMWQKEGEISDVDMKGDIVAVINRGVAEIYTVQGDEMGRYGEGTCSCVSLTSIGILAVGLSDGGVVLLDITGEPLQEYDTGAVSAVSISEQGEVTAYREQGTIYVLDIMGEPLYALEDGGSSSDRILVTPSQYIFAQAQTEVFLYDGENVIWNSPAGGCTVGLALSEDEETFGVCGSSANLYAADGKLLFELPKGNCGAIAFFGEDVVVSDSSTVYYLRLEEKPAETEAAQESPPPEESEESEEKPPQSELGDYNEWFSWFKNFISTEGNTAQYLFTAEEEGESQQMKVTYTIEGVEENNLIEIIGMTVQVAGREMTTTFKRWIDAEGNCTKAEMTVENSTTSIKCKETNIRGIDLRAILSSQNKFEYVGQEEITVERGTFTCHKLQLSTENGMMTLWIYDDLPPVRITLQQETATITMELT